MGIYKAFFRKKKLQSYKATKLQTPFLPTTEKSYKETEIQSNRHIFFGKKKATKKRRYRATDPIFFREKKSYKETKIRSYKLPFLGQTLKKVTKKQKYRVKDPFFFGKKKLPSYRATKLQTPFFSTTEKKLQRNEDTELQTTI